MTPAFRRPGPCRVATLVLAATWMLAGGPVARAQTSQAFDMGSVFAKGGELHTSGTLNWSLDKERKLVQLIAKDHVYLHSEELTLFSDTLTYVAKLNTVVALGNPVRIQQGPIGATCKKFELYPDEGKSILTGSPVIRHKLGPGEPTEVSGEKITIIQKKDGTIDFFIDGGKINNSPQQPSNGANGKPGAARRTLDDAQPATIEITGVEKKMQDKEKPVLLPGLRGRKDAAPVDEKP